MRTLVIKYLVISQEHFARIRHTLGFFVAYAKQTSLDVGVCHHDLRTIQEHNKNETSAVSLFLILTSE
jgi:hypothetical protein